MKASVARALANALDHHRLGRLSDAEAGYREVLESAPDHPEALHRLGSVEHQLGRSELALHLIGRAIAVNPRHPAYYNDAGIVLHALGRLDDAAASFRRTLSLVPDHVAAQNNLANVLREQGKASEAVAIYRAALARGGASHDLSYNLANALADLGAYDEAVTRYAQALGLGETKEAIAGFIGALVSAPLRDVPADVRRLAVRALATPWARPADLAAACIRLLAGVPAMRTLLDRAWNAWPSRIGFGALFGTDAAVVLDDPLMRTLLESAPVCDPHLERLLTLARCALLDAAAGSGVDTHAALPFACSLARQCFINDYVFASTDDEIAHATRARDALVGSLTRGEAVSAADVASTATYFPLHSLGHDDALLARAWPEPLDALLTQQLREPTEERRLRDGIRRLTSIDDPVSMSVRRQYEEHPYPKWVALPASATTGSPDANPGSRFPRALWQSAATRPLDILVAGCGTGQESIEIAQAFPRSRVLAVDLSLASLGYAARKAHELGLANVEHAQADIMRLRSLGRTFDVVSSVGVLHHLADPAAGLRELASLLAPDAHMLVGLYSERSRGDVVAARRFIAERGYAATAGDIRRCRQDLISANDARFAALALRSDFYVTGECRDLLFHVREQRFTLAAIADMLAALGLRFNGFLLTADVAARYAQRYPSDPGMENLQNWERLEAEFPSVFAGMYIFWLQKR